MFPPERIVCLTEETVETLYLLGEERRIVGVSGYAVRPPRVRKEKPRVSAFISADFEKILALEPDLVLTFSDLQADIAAELIRRNVAVHAFNQRDVAGILAMIRTLGALTGARSRPRRWRRRWSGGSTRLAPAAALKRHPAGLFRGMGRADDLRHPLGGGADRDRRRHRGFPGAVPSARTPRTASYRRAQLIAAAPDIIVGSWCGKKFVAGESRGAAGLRRDPCGARRLAARDQIAADPAAGTGGAHRRARRARRDHLGVGGTIRRAGE